MPFPRRRITIFDMPVEIVGRERELALLRAFLDDASEGPAQLVLEGEAGIGKTVLWQAGVEEAGRRGFRVLAARPAEAEQGFAHAGLGDLFEPWRAEVLPALPAPRRRALEVALLLGEPAGAAEVDPRALGVAVADSLQVLAGEAPVLVAIDDVQWLDASSARALAFALRRLPGSVAVLLARRRAEARLRPWKPVSPRRTAAGCVSARSASERSTGSCASGRAGPSGARRSCASTSMREATRSSPSSSRARSRARRIRCAPFPSPTPSRSSCGSGSASFPPRAERL